MSDGRECGWMGCGHPRCADLCNAVPLAEWQDWKEETVANRRWTLSPRRGDMLRRIRCALTGHRWETNPRETQRMCPRCWTAEELQ